MMSRLGVMGNAPLSLVRFFLSNCGAVLFSFSAFAPIPDLHPLEQSILIIDRDSVKLKGENISLVELIA